jgi:hypothetical protein
VILDPKALEALTKTFGMPSAIRGGQSQDIAVLDTFCQSAPAFPNQINLLDTYTALADHVRTDIYPHELLSELQILLDMGSDPFCSFPVKLSGQP